MGSPGSLWLPSAECQGPAQRIASGPTNQFATPARSGLATCTRLSFACAWRAGQGENRRSCPLVLLSTWLLERSGTPIRAGDPRGWGGPGQLKGAAVSVTARSSKLFVHVGPGPATLPHAGKWPSGKRPSPADSA